jgi:hypothetical protein
VLDITGLFRTTENDSGRKLTVLEAWIEDRSSWIRKTVSAGLAGRSTYYALSQGSRPHEDGSVFQAG